MAVVWAFQRERWRFDFIQSWRSLFPADKRHVVVITGKKSLPPKCRFDFEKPKRRFTLYKNLKSFSGNVTRAFFTESKRFLQTWNLCLPNQHFSGIWSRSCSHTPRGKNFSVVVSLFLWLNGVSLLVTHRRRDSYVGFEPWMVAQIVLLGFSLGFREFVSSTTSYEIAYGG